MISFESICARDILPEGEQIPAHILPIYATSTFLYGTAENAMEVFKGNRQAYLYSRWANPTIDAVEEKIAALETYGLTDANGNPLEAKALIFSSGMAAISALFLSNLKPGEAVVTSGNIYGTTTELLQTSLAELGMKAVFTDLTDMEQLEDILKSTSGAKMIYIESPSNPTIQCYDIEAIATIGRKYGCKIAVDNTFASPYLQQPFRFGADFVVHSTTKYLNGHGTAISGIYIGTDIPFIQKKAWRMRKLYGGNSNAFDAWLLNNGIKTLPLRMEKHCSNAKEIANWLNTHPAIAHVNYNGLETHEGYAITKKQMRLPGGMISFELKAGFDAGVKMMNNIRFCSLTSTLGTTDTLITHPASMTHINVSKEQRLDSGITDGLIRMAVGLESVEDIIADLEQSIAG